MSIESTIKQFYSAVEKAGALLSDYRQEIDERQNAVQSCISSINDMSFSESCSETILDELCKKLFEQYNKSIDSWRYAIVKYLKGKEFVNQFEKSLLLIVFADVKAGKSSLGNFVSGYAFRDTPYAELYTAPICYSYDHADKSLKCGEAESMSENYFVEDEIQATASIQYFTLLNGLTWVDTPGIHSLTTEYEDLAKEYVKYADLILFLTPSNNPIKQDEASEIKKLVKCDKPMLIAISKSDMTTMSVVDGKLQTVLSAKSDADREAQEKYTAERIGEIGQNSIISQNQYISISTKMAKYALLNQDNDFFEKSNIPAFFEQISNIISEKAIALKMKRPHDELNSVIDELLDGDDNGRFIGLHQLCNNISSLINDIDEQSQHMLELRSMILTEVNAELGNKLYQLLYKEKNEGNLSRNEYISQKIDSLVNDVLTEVITENIAGEISGFNEVQIENAHVVTKADFCIKKQTLNYEVQEGKERKRAPHGIIEHIQSWFGKEFTEYSVRSIKRTREIETGDNFNEYAQKILSDIMPQTEKLVHDEIDRISVMYFGNMKDSVSRLEAELNKAENKLVSLKYS